MICDRSTENLLAIYHGRLLEGGEGEPMALELIGIGRGGVPEGAFQFRIENAFLRRVRLKHHKTPQDFAAADATYPDWGDLSCRTFGHRGRSTQLRPWCRR